MRSLDIILFGLCLLSLSACGRKEPPFTDNSQDPEAYARTMRRLVQTLVQRAHSGDAATQMGILATELNHTDRPLGEHRAIFQAMRDVANEAVAICRDTPEGRKPSIQSQLDDLTTLADQLPGTPNAAIVSDKAT